MPILARSSAGHFSKSVPSKVTLPEVAGSSPMMHFRSVVLPMPLRRQINNQVRSGQLLLRLRWRQVLGLIEQIVNADILALLGVEDVP